MEVLVIGGYGGDDVTESERVVGRPYKFTSTLVEGEVGQKVAELWRHLPMKGPQAKCHHPSFGLRFFCQEKLVLEATLCYDCHNLYIKTNGERFLRAFNSDDATYAQKLLKVMQKVTHELGEASA